MEGGENKEGSTGGMKGKGKVKEGKRKREEGGKCFDLGLSDKRNFQTSGLFSVH